jgi:hypothetical protein
MANLAVQSKRISIHRIVDLDLFAIPLETIFPDGRIAALNPFAEALADRHVDFAAGKVLLTIQSHLLRFGGIPVSESTKRDRCARNGTSAAPPDISPI